MSAANRRSWAPDVTHKKLFQLMQKRAVNEDCSVHLDCHVLCLLLVPEPELLVVVVALEAVVVAGRNTCVLYSLMWMAELCRDWVW